MKIDEKELIAETLGDLRDVVALLKPRQLAELRASMIWQTFGKNEVIFREGEVPQSLHCLIRGKVKIYKTGVGGRAQILRMVKPAGHFGYRAYFANQNHAATAAAFEPSVVCLVPIELIQKWMLDNPPLGLHLIRLLASAAGHSDLLAVSLTQKHIRGRLAEALLALRDSYGFEPDGLTLALRLSREDLANLSNMTTSNAIRTLSAFAQEHIVTIDGKKIKINDPEALERISKIG